MGVSYELIFVDLLLGEEKGDTMRELRRFNPECTFPTLVVGDRVIVGYKEEAIREALRDHSG
jgi:glutathione S-transferase